MSRSFASLLALSLTVAGACRSASTPRAENLVLVTIDTLRADRLGIYGSDLETPRLDAIAREGAFAENALVQVPLTRPSHLSLFTSRYPFEHGVRQNVSARFELGMPLLAEILREEGLRTAAFVSSIVLASESGLDRGFETYSDELDETTEESPFLDSVQRRGDRTLEDASSWLRQRPPGPFFLWVHLYDPHDPYEAPEPFRSRYAGRPYDGEVAFSDQLVGKLDDLLQELGDSERTLFVVTSDHGEAFEEHGETGHGYFVYDATLRVPLILRGPGIEPGTEIATPIETVDLLPTLLDLLGLAPPPGASLRGRSFASVLQGGDELEPKPIYAESLMAALLYGWGELVSIREGAWKLIEAPKPELYHLEEDPLETDNRIEKNQRAAERLRARLEALAPPETRSAAESLEMDPELLEKLGALGYVGTAGVRGGAGSNVDPKEKLQEFRFLNARMREGLTHLQKKAYHSALESFREVLASGSESFEALYHMGRALFGLGRHREAASALEGALAIEPRYGPAYLDLAEAHFALGEGDRAVSVLRRGQSEVPRSARLHEREGEYWVSQNRPREAARAFEAVVERVPEDALARVRLGEQYRDLGEIEASLGHLREAVRLAPEEASYWNSLGMVLGGNARMEEAESAFRKAHQLEPDHEQYAFNLGLALARLGQREEARGFFRKALENDPDFEPARIELSRLSER